MTDNNNNIQYNYLDLLNEQQRAAVEYKDGAELVIAGAGSGKTRVLTYKIVDLISNGYDSRRIMALTFTNKAAREMKDRIRQLVGDAIADRLWMGTFHSIFLRILRRHVDLIGYKSNFTIYDASDSRSLIKMIIKDLQLDEKAYKPAAVASVISNAKNAMISPQDYVMDRKSMEVDKYNKRPLLHKIYDEYVKRCHAGNAMDFDDILYHTNMLLRKNPDVRRHYQEFFQYILVDEYQDTNFAQHLIVEQLSDQKRNICVVGDDAQSIYSFRGANISNIIDLEKFFPGLKTFKLERNYRSTQNIVNAAGSLISRNTRQLIKHTYSENDPGEKIEVIRTYSDMEEASIIANKVTQTKMTWHDSYDDCAILYRTNAQSRVLEEALRKRNIPYRIYGGLAFYQRKEIKDLLAYFRMAVNPDDDEALRRIINFPARGIGETTLKKLYAAASAADVSIWAVISDIDAFNTGLNAGAKRKIASFVELINEFIDDNKSSNAYELGQLVINRTGILADLQHDNTPESISRKENITELLSGLKYFIDQRELQENNDNGMSAYLSEVSLATDQDAKEDNPGPKITLMTAHAAKGLEFNHIFIVGVEEELFPSIMGNETLAQVEEERRLLYVAITRAKQTCTITYAGSRFRNGQTMLTRPSRFISDIDPKYLRVSESSKINDGFINPSRNYMERASATERIGASAMSDYPRYNAAPQRLRRVSEIGNAGAKIRPMHSVSDLKQGMLISHDKFGKGKIMDFGHISGEDSITVDFGALGIKKLILKFAKFNILE